MPNKYEVALSDGRKFIVEADGPPSEQDVLQALGPSTQGPQPLRVSHEAAGWHLPKSGEPLPGSGLNALVPPERRGEGARGVLKLAKANPGAAGATLAGAAAAPFTGGLSIPAAMAAEGGVAAGGAFLGHVVKSGLTGDMASAKDVASDMALQGTMGALGTGAVMAAPSAIRGAWHLAKNAPPAAVNLAASYIPGGRTIVNIARGLSRIGGAAPDAAPAVANTGGRLVKSSAQPSVENAMTEALQEVRTASPKPSTSSLPPQAQLPPGYVPRTSAPAIKLKPKETPPAAAPAQSSAELPASWQQFSKEPAERSGAAATGHIGPRGVGEGLSTAERDALKRELTARGGTPDISADDAARYLREYGQLIPPGTRASRQGRYINNALEDQRYRFHLDNPASALALLAGGGAAFRQALLSQLAATADGGGEQ